MTPIEKKILTFFGNYPERQFYAQEIAGAVHCSKASVSAVMRTFLKKGLVFGEVRGRMKFYRINPKHVEVKKWKIDSALHSILGLVKRLSPHTDKIILFGSAGRGEQTVSSDIDLFILTRKKADAQRVVAMVKSKCTMNAAIKTPQEWAEMEVREPEFYQEIKNGITVHQYVPRI